VENGKTPKINKKIKIGSNLNQIKEEQALEMVPKQ